MAQLPPGPARIFKLTTVNSIEEAERIAGFKARRPARGTLHSVAVGLAFGFPVILVANQVGPDPTNLETEITDSSTKLV